MTDLRRAVGDLMPRALTDLAELVSMRSVADAQVEDPAQCVAAAQWVAAELGELGLDARLARTPDGSDAVIATYDGPTGAPRVLLYAHYDVQPVFPTGWVTDPWTLTEKNGRYYGRGAADCKGNIVAHLTALRALRGDDGAAYPVSLTVVVEGSEEQGGGGLEDYVKAHPQEFVADVIIIGDVGNIAVGVPTLTVGLRGTVDATVRVRTGSTTLHSGAFGGAAPDAVAALIAILATFRDEDGNTVVRGLDASGTWTGTPYPEDDFRVDAGTLVGVRRLGSGTVADQVWARPALTVIGLEAPAIVGSVPAIVPTAAARLNLRIPPGQDGREALAALTAHVHEVAPWGVEVEVIPGGIGEAFAARQDTEAFAVLSAAMADAFGAPTQTAAQGGSIPLTAALAQAHPDASIVMVGVAEPASKMHAENESVDPAEIEHLALAEALFLQRLA